MVKLPTKEIEIVSVCPSGILNIDRELLEDFKRVISESPIEGVKEVIVPMGWFTKEVYTGSPDCPLGTLAWMANKKIIDKGLTNIGVFFHVDKKKLVVNEVIPEHVKKVLAEAEASEHAT